MTSVAAIIPTRDRAALTERAVASVLAQTRTPDEIVCADDASTDDTVERLRQFGDRVRVIENDVNEGPGAKRCQAIQASTGAYLALFDPDDRWEPDHLEEVAGLLDRWPEAVLAFSRVERFGAEEGIWPEDIACLDQPRDLFADQMRNSRFQASAGVLRSSSWSWATSSSAPSRARYTISSSS